MFLLFDLLKATYVAYVHVDDLFCGHEVTQNECAEINEYVEIYITEMPSRILEEARYTGLT